MLVLACNGTPNGFCGQTRLAEFESRGGKICIILHRQEDELDVGSLYLVLHGRL
jgi:hypothetical protein